MIARICLLSLCLALAGCADPQTVYQGTVGFTRLDDCRFVLRPGGNSDNFEPFMVIKAIPACMNSMKQEVAIKGDQPGCGTGPSHPECDPPRVRGCEPAHSGIMPGTRPCS